MICLDNLSVQFGGVVALDAVSVDFHSPVSGIIGPNGAGKTTMMNVISGFIESSGAISYQLQDISTLAAHHRTRWGLRRSFQREQLAGDLSVRDNLHVILDSLPGSRTRKREDVNNALKMTGLSDYADRVTCELNSYDRRLIDIARCLIGSPKIILLDEPCGGLTREETDHLGSLILQIHEITGAMTLVIDHDVDLIRRICSETLVLDFGKCIAYGDTKSVLDDAKVQAAYLGIDEVA